MQSPNESMKSIRIVLVDDQRIFREGLQCLLRQEPDFEVVSLAANSQEAYSCIERTAPNVVISDLDHPGDSGLIATGKIRREHPEIKILILTSDTSATTARNAFIAGAHGFVRKTDTSDFLVKAVREIMSGRIIFGPDSTNVSPVEFVINATATHKLALTEHELGVLKHLADGLSYKEIADQLHVSVKSVEYYRTGLVRKTSCVTRAELVRYAVRIGIIAA
jgi:two-component system, NarL family, response regulator NreC